MKTGKISENVLKRSVLRLIKECRKEVIKGAEVGGDCAFLSWKTDNRELTALSTQTITLPVRIAPYLAVAAAVNNLAAAGSETVAVTLSLTLPAEAAEEDLKNIMEQTVRCCDDLQVQIAGGHTEISPLVEAPVITVTAVGTVLDGQAHRMGRNARTEGISRDMDLVLSKWIGLEGTAILAYEKEEELLKRYPKSLVVKAKEFKDLISVAPEAAIALRSGVYAMHDVRNGGIFGALWELSQKIGAGLSVCLKEIPIKQETIEICEYYDLNPYELLSGGCLLMAAENGPKLVEALDAAGICAFVIGRTNGTNDKIVHSGDEIRYLTMPAADEIWKVPFGRWKLLAEGK